MAARPRDDLSSLPLEKLDLTSGTCAQLTREGLLTVGDVMTWVSGPELFSIPSWNARSLEELAHKLVHAGADERAVRAWRDGPVRAEAVGTSTDPIGGRLLLRAGPDEVKAGMRKCFAAAGLVEHTPAAAPGRSASAGAGGGAKGRKAAGKSGRSRSGGGKGANAKAAARAGAVAEPGADPAPASRREAWRTGETVLELAGRAENEVDEETLGPDRLVVLPALRASGYVTVLSERYARTPRGRNPLAAALSSVLGRAVYVCLQVPGAAELSAYESGKIARSLVPGHSGDGDGPAVPPLAVDELAAPPEVRDAHLTHLADNLPMAVRLLGFDDPGAARMSDYVDPDDPDLGFLLEFRRGQK